MIWNKEISTSMKILEECLKHNESNKIYFVCNCYQKLCLTCIDQHYHDSMSFVHINDYFTKFLQDLKLLDNFISSYEIKINKLIFYREKLSNSELMGNYKALLKIKEKMLKLKNENFISVDQIINFNSSRIVERTTQLILEGLYKLLEENNRKVIEERQRSFRPSVILKAENIFAKFPNGKEFISSLLKNENKQTSGTKSKKNTSLGSTDSLFNSNKENISPGSVNNVENSQMLSNLSKMTSNMLNIFPNTTNFACTSKNSNEENINSRFSNKEVKIPIPKIKWTSRGSCINFNLDTNFQLEYDSNHGFIESQTNEPNPDSSHVRIVCITCRDTFPVPRDKANWMRRCDVCTENISIV